MQLYVGRPEVEDGRSEKELQVYDMLDKLHISYERVDHAPAKTIQDCEEIDKTLGIHICKNLFLCNRKKTEYYLLLLPGEKILQTKELSAQLSCSRLSFASGTDMEKFLNVSPGAATVMGLLFDTEKRVQLLVDEEIWEEKYIACHPCVNTSSIKVRTEDVFGTFLETVGHDYQKVKLTSGRKDDRCI